MYHTIQEPLERSLLDTMGRDTNPAPGTEGGGSAAPVARAAPSNQPLPNPWGPRTPAGTGTGTGTGAAAPGLGFGGGMGGLGGMGGANPCKWPPLTSQCDFRSFYCCVPWCSCCLIRRHASITSHSSARGQPF